jgi:RNA polymerase sigma factor (sigma-70 family)
VANETVNPLTKYLRNLSSAARVDSLPDRELIERFAARRDEDAFAALVRRHGPMVLRVCQCVLHDGHDAEDAFQATFLVLCRKAASLRRVASVGCFLHGVAYRLALKARTKLARQRMHESRAAIEHRRDDPLAELSVREAQAIVDEELARLPEKYRAPLLLCCLQGRTRDEAARQLGWSVKLVKSRLEQGRERLRSRLSRRGLTVPAALAATLLTEEAASAALPAMLMRITLQTVLAGSGKDIAPSVALLAEGALGGMASVKAKVVVGLLLLTGVLAAGVSVVALPQAAKKEAETPFVAKAPEPAKAEEQRPTRTDRYGDPLPAGAVARIGSVRWWCGYSQCPLVYAPDGKSVVCRDRRGTVYILDAATGKELRRIDIAGDGVSCFALAPNGKTLATAGRASPEIRIWDVPTGKVVRRIEGDKFGTYPVVFSPDGKILAAAINTNIRLWDTATWKEMRPIEGKEVWHDRGIFFLPDGKTLISGDSEGIRWWDMASGREVRRINRNKDGQLSRFYFLAVSPNGKRVAAMQSTNLLLLWDGATGKEIRRIELGSQFFGSSCLCFSPDSQTLVCGNGIGRWGNQTLFFAASTGKELRRWDEGDNYTTQLAFSPDGKIVAQILSKVIRLRDAVTGKPVVPDLGLPRFCMAVRFSRDGKALIADCLGGRIGSWNPLTGESLAPLRDPPEGFGRRTDMLLGTALTVHGERAALVNNQGVLHIWEPAIGKLCCRIAEPPVGEDQAVFSPDGKQVAIKHKDDLIRLWDAKTGKLLRSFPRTGEGGFPHPHAFSFDGLTLAIAPALPDDGAIRLRETATGKEKARLVWRDSTMVNCLLFSPVGKYLLAAHHPDTGVRGSEQFALRLWDLASGRVVRRFPAPPGDIRAMVFSPDGKTVAAAVYDTILLWEFASGAERGRFTGHRDSIWSMAFSPDGRLLASGSCDYTACVWDVTGLCPDGQWPPRRVNRDELERLWNDLGSKDGMRAYHAVWRLAAAGPSAVIFLTPQLRPVPRVEEEKLIRLIADLDSDAFATRERASAELQRLGEQAEPALRKALAAKPSLELSRRVRALLDQVESRTLSTEQLHTLRAVEVLEHIGTDEARAVLRSLAAGAPAATLTREAKATLERLTDDSSNTP